MNNRNPEYKGYSVINTEEPADIIKRLNAREESIKFDDLEVSLPHQFQVEGILSGRTPIIMGKFIDSQDGVDGEFNNYYIVRVLDGIPKDLLVPPDKIKIIP
ncbi:MAG: hypothetical protein V1808_00965 [Candidatus Daviesbacteria bacterium]